MKCAACEYDNAVDTPVCLSCGAPVTRPCLACGAVCPLDARFCAQCGNRLADLESVEVASRVSSDAAERRQITVVFCDLVGSMQLSEQLDPEDLRTAVQAYQRAASQAVEHYDGHVAQRLGDGLLIYFGYPRAHENDPARAIHASLEILSALPHLNLTDRADRRVTLSARIAIHTGVVVIGGMGDGTQREQLALGDVPNLAARLQHLASPNSVVVSDLTAQLASGEFTYADLGSQVLKGVGLPVRIWRVEGVSAVASRFDAATQGRLTPMVAREHELSQLLKCWQLTQAGQGQVALLGGEPGIGKSRLLSALREHLELNGAQSLRYQCSPYHTRSAFYPIIANFERALGLAPNESAASKVDQLEALMIEGFARPREDVRFIAAMLSLPTDRYEAINMSPQRFKNETLRVLADLAEAAALQRPTVMLYEDAHWADPTSLEVLDILVERVKTVPLLIVITHRPEFLSSWRDYEHVTSMTLTKLTRIESGELVNTLTGGKLLPEILFEQVLTKTDGVPLFVEELTRTVLLLPELKATEDGFEFTGAVHNLALPTSLRDSLMASLDRSMQMKEIAQIGAVLGRTFSYELVQAIAPRAPTDLEVALAHLTASGLATRSGVPPEASYTFKHALVQDAAYDSLLKARRLELHAEIARVIEARFPARTETEPELLAHHYAAAGRAEPAIAYWLKAAKRAANRSAHREALAQLDAAAVSFDAVIDGDTRMRLALQVQLLRAGILLATKGMSDPDTGAAYDRAHELCGQLGDEVEESVSALFGIYVYHLVRGDALQSTSAAQDALRRALRIDKPELLVLAHRVIGASLVQRGELNPAVEHLNQAVELYDPVRDRESAAAYGSDLKAVSLAWLGYAKVLAGNPDSALSHMHQAIQHAESLKNFHGVALMQSFLSLVHSMRREPVLALEAAERGMAISKQHELNMWSNYTKSDCAAALIESDKVQDGIEMMEQYFAGAKITGHRFNRPLHLSVMAIGAAKLRDWRSAAGYLDDAIGQTETVGERWFEAEIHRLRGEHLLAEQGLLVADQAVDCFRRSLEVARAQGARLWELRSSMSLARLLKMRGKSRAGYEIVAPVYAGFSEGFSTRDLIDAKNLIEELSRAVCGIGNIKGLVL